MSESRIFDLADGLVRRYKTRNPLKIAEALGVNVVYYDLGSLKGLYNVCLGARFIALNYSLEEELLPVIAAHELGHDTLHREMAENRVMNEVGVYDMSAKPEREANVFAANILISDKAVIEEAREGRTAEEIARLLSVPYDLLLIKLADMNKRGEQLRISELGRGNFLAY